MPSASSRRLSDITEMVGNVADIVNVLSSCPPATCVHKGASLPALGGPGGNGVKLRRDRHEPEVDLRQRRQPAGLAGLAGLVPAAGALGLALVAAAGAHGHQAAVKGDLEGQVGGEAGEAVRGKMSRSR